MCSLSVIPDFIFRKVLVRGKWDHEHSMLLGPRVRDGLQGYHVVTPLVRLDGSTVLVDRGFVSKDAIGKCGLQQKNGEVEVLGMLRMSQSRNAFTPDNHPERSEWYWADVTAMSEFAGGERAGVQPVFIEEIFGEFNNSYLGKAPDDSQRVMPQKQVPGYRREYLSVEKRRSMCGMPICLM
jgi:surfeit locus 1 family protein